MADIHIHEKLDTIDYLSVFIYRSCFIIYALLIIALGFSSALNIDPARLIIFLCFTSLLSASCMHVYDKKIRWVLLGASLFAMLWSQFHILPTFALGASLVTLCGLSIKEYYCFRLPVIRITPLVLVAFWVSFTFIPWLIMTQVFAILSATLLFVIGFAKFKQPFDFDIGDKSKFQI